MYTVLYGGELGIRPVLKMGILYAVGTMVLHGTEGSGRLKE